MSSCANDGTKRLSAQLMSMQVRYCCILEGMILLQFMKRGAQKRKAEKKKAAEAGSDDNSGTEGTSTGTK